MKKFTGLLCELSAIFLFAISVKYFDAAAELKETVSQYGSYISDAMKKAISEENFMGFTFLLLSITMAFVGIFIFNQGNTVLEEERDVDRRYTNQLKERLDKLESVNNSSNSEKIDTIVKYSENEENNASEEKINTYELRYGDYNFNAGLLNTNDGKSLNMIFATNIEIIKNVVEFDFFQSHYKVYFQTEEAALIYYHLINKQIK